MQRSARLRPRQSPLWLRSKPRSGSGRCRNRRPASAQRTSAFCRDTPMLWRRAPGTDATSGDPIRTAKTTASVDAWWEPVGVAKKKNWKSWPYAFYSVAEILAIVPSALASSPFSFVSTLSMRSSQYKDPLPLERSVLFRVHLKNESWWLFSTVPGKVLGFLLIIPSCVW